jgi:nicotinamide mononucleotide (NMN) deamidase PncC
VYICVVSAGTARDFTHAFDGDPAEVVALTVEHALRHLSGMLLAAAPERPSAEQ